MKAYKSIKHAERQLKMARQRLDRVLRYKELAENSVKLAFEHLNIVQFRYEMTKGPK